MRAAVVLALAALPPAAASAATCHTYTPAERADATLMCAAARERASARAALTPRLPSEMTSVVMRRSWSDWKRARHWATERRSLESVSVSRAPSATRLGAAAKLDLLSFDGPLSPEQQQLPVGEAERRGRDKVVCFPDMAHSVSMGHYAWPSRNANDELTNAHTGEVLHIVHQYYTRQHKNNLHIYFAKVAPWLRKFR